MRIRLNQEYRNKIANRMRVGLEQENTQEKEKFFQSREEMKPLQDQTWKLAQEIVSRHYTPEDIKMAYHLQNKFDNVNTIAKDSCFHFGYMAKKDGNEDEDTNAFDSDRHDEQDDKYITKHFDFRLDGNINGSENSRQNDFAYAYFRDELKGREDCNPDINIEMADKQSNPHQTKFQDANEKYLGTNGGSDNQTSYAKEWNDDYKLDLIGREYCRDRQLDCSKQEFDTLMIWQVGKAKLIQCHTKWIETVLEQLKVLKSVLRDHIYLEQTIELCNKMGITISETDILATTSKGIVDSNTDVLSI